ncbi:hypothetical protein [Tenacibaculum sp. M341]|uniref:hypothetical protein n=1 Tax=Tenacibaculum sp. M341 TaxID=2530339 RepID=UPI001043D236|nr:hypothetical protein [Tenacibaculum sp. M341]TCI92288.1 hypothetical protein EYW44_08895 [Tenacibaculum sp. M341]
MIDLNEYLGGITSSISEARMMSDLKSLEIAEQFAKHDLLKHFSIPRFKAQNIELTIPVAIGALENSYEKDYQPVDNVNFNSKTYAILKDVAQQTSFERNFSTKLKSVISNEITNLEKEIKAGKEKETALKNYVNKISNAFLDLYFENTDKSKLKGELFLLLQIFFKPIDPKKFNNLTIEALEKVFNSPIPDEEIKDRIQTIVYQGIEFLEQARINTLDKDTELVYYHTELLENYATLIINNTHHYFEKPINISEAEEKLKAELFSRGNFVASQNFYAKMTSFLINYAQKLNNIYTLTPGTQNYNYSSEVSDLIDFLERGTDPKIALIQFIEEFSSQYIPFIRNFVVTEPVNKKLETTLASSIKERKVESQKTKVIVESHKLQDLKPENVMQIKMTLNEEGLEWHSSENEKGDVDTKLLPE